MSLIYVGFCVMKCAFIAMFVSVCEIVNFFFFWSEFFPLIYNWKHSFHIQFTWCDFSSSSFPSTKTPAHLGSSTWLFPVTCNSSTSLAFFNLGLAIFTCAQPSPISLPQLGHSALSLWEVEINGHPGHGFGRPAPMYCVCIQNAWVTFTFFISCTKTSTEVPS